MQDSDGFQHVFGQPRRQHFLGVVRYFTKNFVQLVRAFLPALPVFAFSEEVRSYGSIVTFVVFGLVVLSAVIEYWRFRFHVDGQSLIISKGLLERERIIIPFDRIQALQLEQAAWQRVFGLTGLQIDTAGTSGSEVNLQALPLGDANLLRDGIMALRSGKVVSNHESSDHSLQLVTLSRKELIKVGLTQNHIRNGLIAVGALVALYEPFESVIQTWLSDVPVWIWSILGWFWFLFIPLGVFGFIMLSFLISVFGAILKYFNLNAKLLEDEISLQAGLLQRVEYRVPLMKIQVLEWRSNLLRRFMRIETVRILQASSQEQDSSGKGVAMRIPGMSKPSSEQLVNAVFPTWEQKTSSEEIGPAQYLQIRIAVLRSLAVTSLAFIPTSILAKTLLMILGLIWAVGSSKKIHQNMWVSVSPEMCVIHTGWLRRKRSMFSFRQLQRVSLHQNRVMKQRGVAHITMTTAAGNQSVRYINEEDAIRLYNWSLYCIERSHEDWM